MCGRFRLPPDAAAVDHLGADVGARFGVGHEALLPLSRTLVRTIRGTRLRRPRDDDAERRSTRAECAACRCARSARTSRAAPTPTARPCGSATSTSRPTRRGAARTTARATSAAWPTWTGPYGTLVTPPTPRRAARPRRRVGRRVLDEAEDIINAAGPEILAEVQAEQRKKRLEALRPQVATAGSATRQRRPAAAGLRTSATALANSRLSRRSRPKSDRSCPPSPPTPLARSTARPGWSSGGWRPPSASAAAPWPTTDEEIWRYSRIDELDLERFRPGPLATTVSGAGGLLVEPGAAGDLVGSVMADAVDVFAELNSAFAVEPTVLVGPGRARPSPTRSSSPTRSRGDGTRRVPAAGRRRRRRQRGHRRRAVHAPTPDARRCVVPVLELRAGPAARVALPRGQRARPAGVAARPPGRAVGERDSTTLLATVALGGDYARVRTDCRLVGPGRQRRPVAVVLRRGRPDARLPHLPGPRRAPTRRATCCSRGRSAAAPAQVYTGLIRVGKEARGTNAFQTNRNLKLSRRRLGRVGAEPRDREQRRALQPRLDRRPDRRGAALLPREPGRAARAWPSG